ncbi:MAG: molybdenum cofactor biosynthesis protein MoaE [Limisphaerales bacterium]
MKRHLIITEAPVDEAALAAGRSASSEMGAVVSFLGLVRGTENGAPIRALEYESFERMAERQFGLLFDEMARRWPVQSVRVVHRVGVVKVNEPSLWVEIVAPHRGEAFAACQWLIDEMKRVVPIWKRPLTGTLDGSR